MASMAAQKQQKKNKEEKKKRNGQAAGRKAALHCWSNHVNLLVTSSFIHVLFISFTSQDKQAVVDSFPKAKRSLIGLLFKIVLLMLLGLAGAIGACHLTELQKEPVCLPINVAVGDSLSWAREQENVVRQLVHKLSTLSQELLERRAPSEN